MLQHYPEDLHQIFPADNWETGLAKADSVRYCECFVDIVLTTPTVSGTDLSHPKHQIYLIFALGHWMDPKVCGNCNKVSEAVYLLELSIRSTFKTDYFLSILLSLYTFAHLL